MDCSRRSYRCASRGRMAGKKQLRSILCQRRWSLADCQLCQHHWPKEYMGWRDILLWQWCTTFHYHSNRGWLDNTGYLYTGKRLWPTWHTDKAIASIGSVPVRSKTAHRHVSVSIYERTAPELQRFYLRRKQSADCNNLRPVTSSLPLGEMARSDREGWLPCEGAGLPPCGKTEGVCQIDRIRIRFALIRICPRPALSVVCRANDSSPKGRAEKPVQAESLTNRGSSDTDLFVCCSFRHGLRRATFLREEGFWESRHEKTPALNKSKHFAICAIRMMKNWQT